jgi:hypothetical protein
VQKRQISYQDAYERTSDPDDFLRTFQAMGITPQGQAAGSAAEKPKPRQAPKS